MRYELGGITFDDRLGPDANGIRWIVAELDGWDSPELRQSMLDPTTKHGQVITESLYGGRPMTMSGWIDVPDEASFWTARNTLAAATDFVVSEGTLIVRETPAKKCQVRRAGKIQMRNNPDVLVVEFQIPLIAPDPRKYGLDGVVVGLSTATVNNAGNFHVWPTVTVEGSNLLLKNESAPGVPEVRISGSVPAGSVLDFAARTFKTAGGASLYSQLVQPVAWWRLWPGNNVISLTGGPGSITFNPAWI